MTTFPPLLRLGSQSKSYSLVALRKGWVANERRSAWKPTSINGWIAKSKLPPEDYGIIEGREGR